jgi:Fe-S cluster biogenesis protein NfuA
MIQPADERDFQARMQRLESLLHQAEQGPDPAGRERLREIVQTLLELHAVGLEKILTAIDALGEPGQAVIEKMACDELVSSLLLLHGLHPLDVETRVRQALEGVRPYLRSHGGSVELLEVCNGLVRLRLEGSCHYCPSSSLTMQQTVEEAIYNKAPEVTAVEVEGALESVGVLDDSVRFALPVLRAR